MRRFAGVVIATCILSASSLSGCQSQSASAPSFPPSVKGNLSLSDSPVLGKTVQVTYQFAIVKESQWDVINATARVTLPETFELVDGTLKWQGILDRTNSGTITATIKAINKGRGDLTAGAFFSPSPGSTYGDGSTLYTLVLTDRAFVGDRPISFPNDREFGAAVARFVPRAEDLTFYLDFSISYAPKLGDTAELTLAGTALKDAPGTNLSIALPKSLELVGGQLRWEGNMAKGDRAEVKATVKAVQVGRWTISAMGQYKPSERVSAVVAGDAIDVYIFEDGADYIHEAQPEPVPTITLSLSLLPVADQPKFYDLMCTVTAISGNVTNVRTGGKAEGCFRQGNGILDWQGDLPKDVPVQVKTRLEQIKNGDTMILAWVDINSGIGGARDEIYITLSDSGATVSRTPFTSTR